MDWVTRYGLADREERLRVTGASPPVGQSLEAPERSGVPDARSVALAASSAFMTPISPVNALVATAGNYDFADFVRIGLPFTLIAMAVSLLLVPLLLPLD
jgi:di/tricarboxylate transporter